MASVSTTSTATPAQVFDVLRDGWTYSNWVVGTSHMRAVDPGWPAPGTRLHHASGAWPVVVRDETLAEELFDDHRLVLTARGRPFGEARVVIEVAPEGPGSRITLTETPTAGPGRWLHNPASEALLVRRNVEALARLSAIAERRPEPRD